MYERKEWEREERVKERKCVREIEGERERGK